MSRRRLSVVVATGALALAALAGCQVEPGNAAFVGDSTFSQSAMDDIVKQLEADGAQLSADDQIGIRQQIVTDQVFVDVASRYATEKGLGDPDVDAESTAAKYGLPPSNSFVLLEARTTAYQQLLTEKAKARKPTEADLHSVYDALVKQGTTSAPYDKVMQQLHQQDGFDQAVVVRQELLDAIPRYNVRVNPMYDAQFDLFDVQTQTGSIPVVLLPLAGKDSGSVVHDVTTQ